MLKKKDALITLIILLLVAGLFFRDNIPVFSAFSLSLALLADLYIMEKKTEDTANTLSMARNADKKIIIRGKSIKIKADFELNIAPSTQIKIEDRIPEGSIIKDGSAISPVLNKTGKYSIKYELLCLSHGTNRFRGITLTVSDNFFSKHVNLLKTEMKQPVITVFPAPSFISITIPSISGKTTNKETITKGRDVKGYRDYTIYDDIRIIDWKKSAKHNKLIVREYSSQAEEIKTIIINLPDLEDPGAEKNTEILKRVVGSILLNTEITKKVNIIFISGANIKEIFKPGTSYDEIAIIMNKINPAFRDKYLYNFTPVYRDYSQNSKFIHVLTEKSGYFLEKRKPHIFETQIYRVFTEADVGENVVLFTLPENDISHLLIIKKVAEMSQIRTICFISRTDDIKAEISTISCGFDEVKII